MFDVGFTEMLLIALVALLVFGPERLPKLVREAGYWIRKIRGLAATANAEIQRELQVAELRESLQQQRQTVEKELDALPVKPPSQWLPRPPGLEKASPKVDDTDS